MGNFERNNAAKKDREERDVKVREKLAGFFFDLAKLVFAGIVIASFSPMIEGNRQIDFEFGSVGVNSTVILAITGYRLLNKK